MYGLLYILWDHHFPHRNIQNCHLLVNRYKFDLSSLQRKIFRSLYLDQIQYDLQSFEHQECHRLRISFLTPELWVIVYDDRNRILTKVCAVRFDHMRKRLFITSIRGRHGSSAPLAPADRTMHRRAQMYKNLWPVEIKRKLSRQPTNSTIFPEFWKITNTPVSRNDKLGGPNGPLP